MKKMDNSKVKLVIGFITYQAHTLGYLPAFIESLKSQSFKEYKIMVQDNSEQHNSDNFKYLLEHCPEADPVWSRGNIGFGRAYNMMFRKAMAQGVKYFLTVNPDMILDQEMVGRLVQAMDKDPMLGSASPRIFRWNFTANEKTDIIDTCGIRLKSGLKFIDIGQGKENDSSFENDFPILGPSGAAGIYRLGALEKIKEGDNYFDEHMFMYKEDCDLDYRLFLAGYGSKCITSAIAYHDRTVASRGEGKISVALNRKNKSRQVKSWSFLNQQIIIFKYWKVQKVQQKIAIIFSQVLTYIFIIIFERYLLSEIGNLWKIRHQIKKYQ
jgi:GT2 family glycosyltransferase